MTDPAAIQAARNGAARALADVLRAHDPQLAWEVTANGNPGGAVREQAGTRQGVGLKPGSDHPDPTVKGPATLPDPHDAKRAA